MNGSGSCLTESIENLWQAKTLHSSSKPCKVILSNVEITKCVKTEKCRSSAQRIGGRT